MNHTVLDVDAVLDGLDQLSSQRPVAAQVVSTSNSDSAGAAELAAILGADMALAARVMKLANSAYFGLSGRVTSLQLAVTVVGFNTVRSVATVALAGIDDGQHLPDDFWTTSVHLAAAAGALGPRFQVTTADALSLGLLAQLGAALLHQADADGYADLLATTGLGVERFRAEADRYGICSPQLTAEALTQWHFPAGMVDALRAVHSGADGALLRTSYEMTARLLYPHHRRVALDRVSDGVMSEAQAPARLMAIRSDVLQLQAALGL
ncbi:MULTISPECIES: HDOD domain-containing protein [unclassified Nocardioides]|uniref:HDOD domain-containing protein n=1 Tax=unclassified Nocardioides TaxID=2615069 RepID=UPI0011529430|nr:MULTISPECIES: HDOD domain-containing protein [unclassified Nocardioides]TQK69614.1 HD-like signal output (HDOD) protein [Nocardioides sp. SLBN-35]WGY01144.1 HDOD domain-containing protein [Nocardioides sp. QY071]